MASFRYSSTVLVGEGGAVADQWYFTRDNKSRAGPYTSEQLQELARSGQLLPGDQVRHGDDLVWVAAVSVPLLAAVWPNFAANLVLPPPRPDPPWWSSDFMNTLVPVLAGATVCLLALLIWFVSNRSSKILSGRYSGPADKREIPGEQPAPPKKPEAPVPGSPPAQSKSTKPPVPSEPNWIAVIIVGGAVLAAVGGVYLWRLRRTERQELLHRQESWDRSQRSYALTCRRCQSLAVPVPGTGNRYRCENCGNQFVSARHGQADRPS